MEGKENVRVLMKGKGVSMGMWDADALQGSSGWFGQFWVSKPEMDIRPICNGSVRVGLIFGYRAITSVLSKLCSHLAFKHSFRLEWVERLKQSWVFLLTLKKAPQVKVGLNL